MKSIVPCKDCGARFSTIIHNGVTKCVHCMDRDRCYRDRAVHEENAYDCDEADDR